MGRVEAQCALLLSHKEVKEETHGKKVLPKGLLYTKTHEWVEEPTNEIEKEEVRCGITDYARHEMGNIVHVELPKVGAFSFAQVESAQAYGTWETFDIHAPVSGKVTAINERLIQREYELLNTDPYGAGWICKIETSMSSIFDLIGEGPYVTHIETLRGKRRC